MLEITHGVKCLAHPMGPRSRRPSVSREKPARWAWCLLYCMVDGNPAGHNPDLNMPKSLQGKLLRRCL